MGGPGACPGVGLQGTRTNRRRTRTGTRPLPISTSIPVPRTGFPLSLQMGNEYFLSFPDSIVKIHQGARALLFPCSVVKNHQDGADLSVITSFGRQNSLGVPLLESVTGLDISFALAPTVGLVRGWWVEVKDGRLAGSCSHVRSLPTDHLPLPFLLH